MNEVKKQEVVVNFPQDFKGGSYANNMMVHHSKDEFVMDFIMLSPPSGMVVSRVISSPAQMKRVMHALQENIAKYEQKFGSIENYEIPQGDIGFATKQ